MADRGEIEGKIINTFINSLHVKIENTPPYRADWKGIVDRHFKTINTKVKPFLPGFIDEDFRQRGGTDYRLDALLNIEDFTQIMIQCVLYHNNQHFMKSYSRDEMMIEDDIKPIPIDLWNWGITNRSGSLRVVNEDIVKLNLLPTDTVMVMEKGIKYRNMYYSCDSAISERWFEIARNRGTWKLDISYDPRNMDYIYIRTDNGKSFEKCYMPDSSKYGGKSLDEIIYLDAYEKLNIKKNAEIQLQSKVDLYAKIEDIVERAKRREENHIPQNISKTAKVKGIRDNRKVEKDINRKREFFELDKDKSESTEVKKADIYTMSGEKLEDEDSDEFKYLLKKQKERLEKKDD